MLLRSGSSCSTAMRLWWVDAGGPQTGAKQPGGRPWISEPISDGLARLACRIDPSIGAGLPRDAAADWAVGWLQTHQGWLLVLDDVREYEDIAGLLGQLSGGVILITTRRDFGVELPRVSSAGSALMLDGLASAEAVEMLALVTGHTQPDDAKAAGEIGAELGCLPLALRPAAAYICQKRIRPGRYLELLRGYPVRRAALRDAVWRTWRVTVDAVGSQQPEAIGVLQLLSCLAPDDVPRDVLPDDDGAASDALGVLASYCMIRLGVDAVSTHRLVQEAVRADDRNHPATLAAAIGHLLKSLPAGEPVDHECSSIPRSLQACRERI
jgi:hypothetical protein